MPSPRPAQTCRQAAAKRCCQCRRVVAEGQQGDHLGAEVDAGRAGVEAVADLPPGRGEPLLPRTPLLARGGRFVARRRVELGDHHDDRPRQRPAEGLHVLLDVGLLGGATDEQVAQEVALVLVLHRRDGALPGDEQGGHDRHPLQGVHVLLDDRLVEPDADQPGEIGAAGSHAQRPDLAGAHRQPGLVDPLHVDPPGVIDEPGVVQRLAHAGRQRRRAFATVAGGEEHPDVEDVGDLGGDQSEVAPLEHDVGQGGVQRVDAGERGSRPVTAYQHLGLTFTIVGTTSHRQM